MKTFLVTGGCGFIGSHLCEALLAGGHSVRVLDDLSSGKRENLPPGAGLIEGNVGDPATVREALAGVAGCFHLAAIASVERGVREWLATHLTNLGGTVTLFDAIAMVGTPIPVVYASSAAVYGEPAALPLAEDAEKRPLSAYGADKYGSELHAAVATHVHRIPTVGLRFFNVYGPRQDPHSPYSGVVSIFAERLARRLPVTIYGDGGQTRDFVFVADVVRALTAAMKRLPPGAPVFNVCTGVGVSVRELAERIGVVCGVVPEIRHGPAREGEIRHSVGDPERGRQALGLKAPVPIGEGLARLLAASRLTA
ncbi:MAG TPA: NAD-dependent epimerase/dehydratase family protein [Acetobacteraceae bacterium]|nr:NAD-dependent epimerase/dehydratase family protein [Acetobacteraceae bacterium]